MKERLKERWIERERVLSREREIFSKRGRGRDRISVREREIERENRKKIY